MRKLTAFVLGCMMLFTAFSVTAQDADIKGIIKNGTVTVTHTEGDMGVATIMMLDEGKLCGVKTQKISDGVYTFDGVDTGKSLRIFYHGVGAYPLEVATPTPEPVKTPVPAAYETELDAIYAPAVIKEVCEVAVGDELLYELTMLHQGREVVVNVRQKVTISSAPVVVSELTGKTVNYLDTGDVISFVCDLQGRVKDVALVYRPDFCDYYNEGITTNGIIGRDAYNGYHFGVTVGTYKSAIELAGADGVIVDYDVSPDAIVYTVTSSRKGASVTLDGKGPRAVGRVYIPESSISGNVIDWTGMDELSYTLMRSARGIVTDIIVFK